jgi:L-ribulose-5-phosphate 3-epimerase
VKLRLGYNTNGFAHHRLVDAIETIAELGYRSVGITLDVHHLDPFAKNHVVERAAVAELCARLGLQVVVETGARFLLDPRRKHRPTLLSRDAAERRVRVEFLVRAVEIAAALGGDGIVSLWSGSPDEGDAAGQAELDERLVAGLREVCDAAAASGAVVAFEPEPGMYVEDMAAYARVRDAVAHAAFRLTLDVGHAHITEAAGAAATVRAFAAEIANVHVEGMRKGVHDHLVPWEGDLDVRGAIAVLKEVGYAGPATLELSRHSHDAVRVAKRAFEFLAGA